AQAGGPANYNTCVKLFGLAPSDHYAGILFDGVQEGLRGKSIADLPSNLLRIIQRYQSQFGDGELSLAMQQNDPGAIQKALEVIKDKSISRTVRLAYIKILGEIDRPETVPVLLKIIENNDYSDGIRIACLNTLRHYHDPMIGEKVASAYPDKLRANPELRKAALLLFAGRASWTGHLLHSITETRQVNREDVPTEIVRQFKLLDDPGIASAVDELWPEVKVASTEDKKNEILRIKEALKDNSGKAINGKAIYDLACGSCHRLKGTGGTIGPDLTGYDRKNISDLSLNIVDPNASIREGYVNFRVKLKDGQVILGTIVDQSNERMIIKPLGGGEIVLITDQISGAIPQDKSSMPEHLTESLSEQEIRDLFAYLGE
ncbi:MAG: c-type cytochrome, partial [Cyclobacteriaceae bacterium]